MERRWLIPTLVLPLLVIALSIVKSVVALQAGTEWRLAVEGYDPRDLLHGRYLQFRIRPDWEVNAACEEEECCVCLFSEGGNVPPSTYLETCDYASSECRDFVRHSSIAGNHRFYVPEASASSLEKKMWQAMEDDSAFVVVVVDRDGDMTIKELLLNGEPVSQEP